MATLDDLRAMPPGADRARAITAYLAELNKLADEARRLRDEDILAVYIAERGHAVHGVNQRVARMVGMSVSTVRAIGDAWRKHSNGGEPR